LPTAAPRATDFVVEDVRRFMQERSPAAALACGRPVVGPLVTLLRRLAWRALGLEHAFNERHREMGVALSRLEVLRQARYWQFRPGTLDWYIFDHVVLQNEYELPDRFRPDDIILDVGMHIGAFCLAALLRGAGCVHGYEPERENFDLATANLQWFAGRVHLHHQAVWRSDRPGDALFHGGPPGANTGGGSILWTTAGQRLDAVAFDDVLREVTGNGRRRVRLVKMDCEGSEFPILLTSRALHLVDAFCGEYHEINDGVYNHQSISPVSGVEGVERFTAAELVRCLERAGFTVRARRNGTTPLGWFFASRA
jgi:FkbM family methyltransferase